VCAWSAQHTGSQPKRHVCAWSTQHTGRQPKRPRLGRQSARWLQHGARPASVACPAPKPGSHAAGVHSPSGRTSSLTLGFCRSQPHHMPLPNSAIYSENHSQSTVKSTHMAVAVHNSKIHSESTHNAQ